MEKGDLSGKEVKKCLWVMPLGILTGRRIKGQEAVLRCRVAFPSS